MLLGSFLVAFALAAGASPLAAQSRLIAGLKRLDPQTRLEQVCDLEAMTRIRKETQHLPDRAKSNVNSEPKHRGHVLTAKGGAFRSKGKWYALSFVCEGSPDHMKAVAMKYQIGKMIPESKWREYGLWR
jgi:hypothetical protein